MFDIPILRFGQTYESMEKQPVVHFDTGETVAQLHQATGAMVKLDLKKAQKSRDALRAVPIPQLIEICKSAARMYLEDTLPCGNGSLSPAEFCRVQSATTGLPEHMCATNMRKNAFVLGKMDAVLDALTRGLPYDILAKGYGQEGRGVMVSYQATTPVFGMVLPNNSPGVHTLWLPAIPMQIGLCIKPGSQEFWTPYRITEAFFKAGLPREAISVYPGGHDVGGAVMTDCQRAMIFGGQTTVDQHAGNPRISVHGPGFSKIILGDDMVDRWEEHLDLMVDSVFANSGRSCINASGVWASRHTKEIADALAQRLGPIAPLPPSDPKSPLAAFTTTGVAEAMNAQIDEGCQADGVTEMTAKYRHGDRLEKRERCDYLRPTVIHCTGPDVPLANTEYMFPFVSVVECPQNKMLSQIKQTLVCTALTDDAKFKQQLLDATNIDRLNIGPVRTMQLNWLQPHEGNIVDFLFRARAFQNTPQNPIDMSLPHEVSTPDVHSHSDVLIVDANKSSRWLDLRELWRYRDLVWIFAIRDIKVRYRQTIVGIAWTVLQPLAQMLAFGVLKKMLVEQPSGGSIPDDVSVFCGLLLYQLFSGILATATVSLVDNRQVVTKVYFPRIALPLSCCIRPLLDFGIGFVVLVLLMLWFRVPPGLPLVILPIVILLTVLVGLALGLWLSALNAHYRDFGYIVPFLLQLGLIVSPVVYESSRVPAAWRWLYFINPMATLLEAFRWTILGTALPGWDAILVSVLSTLFLLASGAWYFHRVDRFMADNI